MSKKEAFRKYTEAKNKNLVDSLMIPLCEFVFTKENFFTTSSCSGRISLMNVEDIGIKEPKAFYRKWHRTITFNELMQALNEKTEREIWFKLDPVILHIATDTLENSNSLLAILHKTGFKRFGVINSKPGKYIVEFQGNESISLPIKKDSKLLVSEEYLEFLTTKANKKLEKNFQLLDNLFQQLKSNLEPKNNL